MATFLNRSGAGAHQTSSTVSGVRETSQVNPQDVFGNAHIASMIKSSRANGTSQNESLVQGAERTATASTMAVPGAGVLSPVGGLGEDIGMQDPLPATENLVHMADHDGGDTDEHDRATETRDTSDIDALLAVDWGEGVWKNTTPEQALNLQQALQTLGYLPEDAELGDELTPDVTNALMSFQVATSGVDEVATGRNGDELEYAQDGDRNRLQGVVDGKFGDDTRAHLVEQLALERTRRIEGDETNPEAFIRQMGDTPEQREAIAQHLLDAGYDPEQAMQLDTSVFEKMGLRPHVLDAAVDGWENQLANGNVDNTMITVNDFELPDNMRRSFTFDVANPGAGLVDWEQMAHGSGNGRGHWANDFGGAQQDNSHQSVLGGLLVGDRAYPGSKPFGATADGLEPGVNDRADPRLIRTHGPTGGRTIEESQIGGNMSYHSWGCMVMGMDATEEYTAAAREEGGRYNFNFAPHEQYWGGENDVNRD